MIMMVLMLMMMLMMMRWVPISLKRGVHHPNLDPVGIDVPAMILSHCPPESKILEILRQSGNSELGGTLQTGTWG